jgi:AmpD protein
MTDTLKVNKATGLLEPVRFLATTHHDERPKGMPIDMVVVHGISLPAGEFDTGAIEAFFCGSLDCTSNPAFASIAGMRVSSHLLIKRTGEIIQFVPFTKRAWHAGQSSFAGRSGCNDFSIGIELEGTDTVPYELVQYQQLSRVLAAIKAAYKAVTDDRIVGHSDIAPGRKTDPGPHFDWAYLKGITA